MNFVPLASHPASWQPGALVELPGASELVWPLAPQLASLEEPLQPIADAPSADLPAANASSISPRAKMVFLVAVMFVSCLDCP
jgi:hypothetical protein